MTLITVYACTRCGLSNNTLPPKVNLIELQCTGRVSIPLLLAPLASGGDGVLVLGRHQETCRLRGAEDRAQETTLRAGQLAELVGLGNERIRFTEPAPGLGGPERAVETFLADMSGHPPIALDEAAPAELFGREGMDTSLSLLRWLSQRPSMTPQGASWLTNQDLPPATPGGVALATTSIPYLQTIGAPLMRPGGLAPHLGYGLAMLHALGRREVGIWIGGYLSGGPLSQSLAEAAEVFSLDRQDQRALSEVGIDSSCLEDLILPGAEIPAPAAPARVACDGSAQQIGYIEDLGYSALDVGPDPLGDNFSVSPQLRLAAETRLAAAEAGGAQTLLARDVHSLMRWTLQTRQGTWRASRILPVLAYQLAWHNLWGIPLTPRMIQTHTTSGSSVMHQSTEHQNEVLP